MSKQKKVMVAMSGGVDSSLAAFLLLRDGYDVEGLTMKIMGGNELDKKATERAEEICSRLRIRHHTFDVSDDFNKEIIENFINEYLSGRTPNPCVRCNRFIKFGILMEHALSSGADYFASGHYARIKDGLFIRKASDLSKDQSYFLYNIRSESLSNIIFPLGDFSKDEIRSLAREHSLEIPGREESEDACFLQSEQYVAYLLGHGIKPAEGDIISRDGDVLGRHSGCFNYTIGQRKGLGIAWPEPLYVIAIKPEKNKVIVGTKKDTFSDMMTVADLNIFTQPGDDEIICKTRIRYRHSEAESRVLFNRDGTATVKFKDSQSALTPGQSAVFYDDDIILGGGIISDVHR